MTETRPRLNRPSLIQLKGKENLVGCEIGVAYGGNARHILQELSIEKLYLIDPYTKYGTGRNTGVQREKHAKHSTLKHAKELLRKWEDKLVWLHDLSESVVNKIPDNSLDFVYIDGSHLYEGVIKDITLYWSKVKIGGLMAGHDYFSRRKQVVEAVDKCFEKVESAKCPGSKAVDWWIWKTNEKIIKT